jgi:hypothetical protein
VFNIKINSPVRRLADEVINEKSASHILHKQLLGAHEPNLLDEGGKFFPFLEAADQRHTLPIELCPSLPVALF